MRPAVAEAQDGVLKSFDSQDAQHFPHCSIDMFGNARALDDLQQLRDHSEDLSGLPEHHLPDQAAIYRL